MFKTYIKAFFAYNFYFVLAILLKDVKTLNRMKTFKEIKTLCLKAFQLHWTTKASTAKWEIFSLDIKIIIFIR